MTQPYHTIPELDYAGSRSAASRLDGIEEMEPYCSGSSVLDLGCAEGLVSRELARYGASVVHGFDFDEGRLGIANRLFVGLEQSGDLNYAFRRGDFKDIVAFCEQFARLLLDSYDIVLLLGVLHNLTGGEARKFLHGLLPMCGKWLLIRGGLNRNWGISCFLRFYGFRQYKRILTGHEHTGTLRIFARREVLAAD
jgi:2-polyprenyl-3-methyl-5-hydroxy-6-metoxy-1,4-benzoquinol methylase